MRSFVVIALAALVGGLIAPDPAQAGMPPPPAECGDNTVNQPGEQCDGSDDAACPGLCLLSCTCDLGPRLSALEAEADAAPIVVDDTGEVIGSVVGISDPLQPQTWVQIDFPGVPLFALRFIRTDFLALRGSVFFESDDCSGQAWIVVSDTIWGTLRDDGTRLFYVGDSSATPETIFARSAGSDGCVPHNDPVQVVPALLVDLDAMFTPPFRVTTRARLEATPTGLVAARTR